MKDDTYWLNALESNTDMINTLHAQAAQPQRSAESHTMVTRKISSIASLIAFLGLPWTSVSADTIFGVYAGVGSWKNSFDGYFASTGNNIDVESDLSIDDENQGFIYVALEHPIPFLPNVRVSKSNLKGESTNTLSTTLDFEGQTYTAGEVVNTNLDLSHTDFTAYYEILDNWVSMDIGLTARHFSGEASLSSSTVSESASLDAWIPLGYAKLRADLPLTGFYASGNVNAISFNDNGITDYSLALGFESPLRLGAELGYRSITLTLEDVDDKNFTSDLTTDGFYLALTLHI